MPFSENDVVTSIYVWFRLPSVLVYVYCISPICKIYANLKFVVFVVADGLRNIRAFVQNYIFVAVACVNRFFVVDGFVDFLSILIFSMCPISSKILSLNHSEADPPPPEKLPLLPIADLP